jgi:hypothetical protein
MDLTIASIGANELRLIKKEYMDSPAIVEEERKEGPKHAKPGDEKFDPSLFRIPRSQAVAYKEYKVTKINNRGKRQVRVLGIDRLNIHNMTVKEAKQKK